MRDKNTLQDARASIERRMEKFKECEKDIKVKNFSKQGLEKGAKLDPKVLEAEQRSEQVRELVNKLNEMVRLNLEPWNFCLAGHIFGYTASRRQVAAVVQHVTETAHHLYPTSQQGLVLEHLAQARISSERRAPVQVEVNEAEIESLVASLKRNKDPPPRVGTLQVRALVAVHLPLHIVEWQSTHRQVAEFSACAIAALAPV